MKPRNLMLLMIDDESDIGLSAHVDFLRLPVYEGHDDGPMQVKTWDQHCRSLFFEKELSFDLLSVDVNFRFDTTDPMHPFHPLSPQLPTVNDASHARGDSTCSGLYHGALALARRRSRDDAGNYLPLAWHVRSASPELQAERSDLLPDALRGYGLLRALLAEPSEGETFADADALERRLAEDARAANIVYDGCPNLVEQLRLDFMGPEVKRSRGSWKNLLPKWRKEFARLVVHGKLDIVRSEVDRLGERLAKATAPLKENDNASIQIDDGDGEALDEIRLISIFADKVQDGVLPLKSDNHNLLEWFEDVLGQSAQRRRHLGVEHDVNEAVRYAVHALNTGRGMRGDWKNMNGRQRAFFYGLLVLYAHMVKGDRNPGDKDLAALAGFESFNWHTFRRHVCDERPCKQNKPSAWKRALLGAVTGLQQHSIENQEEWIAVRAGMLRFARALAAREPSIWSEATLKHRLPGLFR